MAIRQSTFTVACDAVQGEGSYITLRLMTRGEGKAFRARAKDLSPDEIQALNDQVMADHLVDWNWVDDEGKRLPLPSEDPAVMDLLNTAEVEFLWESFNEYPNAKKS